MTETTCRQNVTRLRFDPRSLNRQPERRPCAGQRGTETTSSAPAQPSLPAAFDMTGIGAAILRPDGHILAQNAVCETMLDAAASGLYNANEALRTRRRPDMRALEQALHTAAFHGKPAALRVRDLEGEGAVELLITPMPARPEGETRLTAILRAPDALKPDADLLEQLYGLTPAEAGLTAALAGGIGLSEACKRRGITVNTGKGYLKRIFQKTGTNRQSELVALVMNGVAAFNQASQLAEALSQTG